MKSDTRYATYCWVWQKPFSLMTHGSEQHYGRRNLQKLDEYCKRNHITPVKQFTDHIPENFERKVQLAGLNEAKMSANNQEYDVLVIIRREEISWNTTSLVSFVGQLRKSNVTIECITDPFTSYLNDGRLIVLPLEPDDPNLKRYGNTT
jgi:DNA invertase Pin-like site-specific DNA recombinase